MQITGLCIDNYLNQIFKKTSKNFRSEKRTESDTLRLSVEPFEAIEKLIDIPHVEPDGMVRSSLIAMRTLTPVSPRLFRTRWNLRQSIYLEPAIKPIEVT